MHEQRVRRGIGRRDVKVSPLSKVQHIHRERARVDRGRRRHLKHTRADARPYSESERTNRAPEASEAGKLARSMLPEVRASAGGAVRVDLGDQLMTVTNVDESGAT